MKPQPRSLLPSPVRTTLASTLLLLAGACATSRGEGQQHWRSGEKVQNTLSVHLLDHERDSGESYWSKLGDDLGNFWLTLRRHFLNSNPENPFQSHDVHRKDEVDGADGLTRPEDFRVRRS